jgi:serralysin
VLGTASTADILFNSVNQTTMVNVFGGSATTLGIADPPGTYTNSGTGDYQSWVISNHDLYSAGALGKGGYDYITWLHELGHALGLAHPHDNGGGSTIYPGVVNSSDLGTDNLNQGIYTTMSYNDGWGSSAASMPKAYGWQGTMMAFDVAALQQLYGANYSVALGNDYYVLGDTAGAGAQYQCIWDAGGTDAIYYSGSNSLVIDLRAATLGTGYGAGGYVSYSFTTPLVYSAITIANGVTIENAFSGSGNDYLIGNESGNWLFSYGGNDTIYGLGGGDYIDAGSGNDIIYAGDGSDSVYGGLGNDQLLGSSGNDYLFGGGGADYFNISQEMRAGDLDYVFDVTLGSDYILVPLSMQGSLYFFQSGSSAYCYVPLTTGGYYVFGAANTSAAQLQQATYLF